MPSYIPFFPEMCLKASKFLQTSLFVMMEKNDSEPQSVSVVETTFQKFGNEFKLMMGVCRNSKPKKRELILIKQHQQKLSLIFWNKLFYIRKCSY